MGIGVIVHGFIDCLGYGPQANTQRVFDHNNKVIAEIPESDPELLFIRDMFSVQPFRTSTDVEVPQYESQVIHFAGSYKNMYLLDAQWVKRFESILSKLCWFRAVAYLEFGLLRYEWEVDHKDIGDQYDLIPPVPPKRWSFQCSQIKTKEISMIDAIDGPLDKSHHKNKNV
jgi:hypothetical protein